MARKNYDYTPTQQFTYDQMMHRRHEIKEQSPWLEDYELDALLADEGYNVSEKAPEGYVFSTGEEEESGIDYVGDSAPAAEAPLHTKKEGVENGYNPYAAYLDNMEQGEEDEDEDAIDAAVAVQQTESEKPKEQTREEYMASQQQRQLRDKARKLLKQNIREETGKMGIALIIYIVLQLVITGLITAYLLFIARYKIAEINVFLATPTNMLPIQGIVLILGLGLPFIAYMYLFRMPIGEIIPVRRMKVSNFMLMTLLGVGFSAMVSYIGNVVAGREIVTGGFTNSLNVLAGNKGIGLLYSIICLCIIPALVEEFVFRGVILQTLRRKGGDAFAIVLSAIMCALVYSNANGIAVFFISLLMGYLVVFTGSVMPAFTVGLLRSILSLVMTLMNMSIPHDKVIAIDAIITVAAIAAGLLAVSVILKRYPDFGMIKEGKSSLTLWEKISVALRSPSMIVLMLYFALFTVLEMISTDEFLKYLK